VANALTVVRLLLVPVFVVFLAEAGHPASTGWRLAALAAFGVASLTDLLDGQLARSRGLVTDFGKIADPIADKALTGAALISLSALGELPGWVTALILAREVGVTALRFAVIRRGVIAASAGGKLKTLLQIAAICLYLLPPSLSPPALVKEIVMGAALVITLVTGVDYVVRAVRLPRQDSGTGQDSIAGQDGAVSQDSGGGHDGRQTRDRSLAGAGMESPGMTTSVFARRSLEQAPSQENTTRELAAEVLRLLCEAGWTVATAESLTGGLVAAALTDIPGASAAFRGGVVSYATDLKARLLGVDDEVLAEHGPVYAPVAAAMAAGVRQRLQATVGVATTGVAGPDPQDGHPPGTVHIAVSLTDDTIVRTIALAGDRDEIRRLTVEGVLGLLLGRLREECPRLQRYVRSEHWMVCSRG